MAATIWQFQRNDGGFSPYQPETSAGIEAAYSRGNSSLTLGQFTINLVMMQQRSSAGTTRAIRRVPCTPPSPSIMAYWEWDQGRGRFVPYDITASEDIELAYMNNNLTVDLSVTPARIPYTVDLTSMHQTRHGYNTMRRVRRIALRQPLVTFLQTPAPSSSSTAGSSGSLLTPASSLLSTTAASARKKATAAAATAGSSSPKSKVKQTAAVGGYQKSKSSSSRSKKTETTTTTTMATTTTKAMTKATTKRRGAAAAAPDPLGPISNFVKTVTSMKFGEDGPCPICMNQLSEASGFEEDVGLPSTPYSSSSSSSPSLDLCRLRKCSHLLHRACLLMYAQNSPDAKDSLRCPTCKKIHGVRKGDMPDGSMTVTQRGYSLPGHEGYGTIEITYNFRPGVHNGVRYRANGFPRLCYLPDSPQGRQVLKLLKVAWERRLTFTIGTSVTTGATNTVVWNEIHHKTESTSNFSGHGYPDPAYLDNVIAELAAQGVEEEDEDSGSDSDQ